MRSDDEYAYARYLDTFRSICLCIYIDIDKDIDIDVDIHRCIEIDRDRWMPRDLLIYAYIFMNVHIEV